MKKLWDHDDEDKIAHFIVDSCEKGLLYSFSYATLREWGVEHMRGCISSCGDKWMAASPYVTVPSEYLMHYFDHWKPGRPLSFYKGSGIVRPSDSSDVNVSARAILPGQGKRGVELQEARKSLRDMRASAKLGTVDAVEAAAGAAAGGGSATSGKKRKAR